MDCQLLSQSHLSRGCLAQEQGGPGVCDQEWLVPALRSAVTEHGQDAGISICGFQEKQCEDL